MKSVCILLSTYNGERFLAEQLDSLLKQKNVELNILIRDDGSKDSTVQIVNEYLKKDKRISFYQGINKGPTQSFFDLISHAGQYDYYAFCDQDDVWDDDKLSIAIQFLENEDNTKPNMYYSNLRIVDKDLNFYRLSHDVPHIQKNKYSVLAENMATGCTIVFNKAAFNMVQPNLPAYCSMHDTWMYLVCKFFGKTVYDFDAHISYRQHENNVVGTYLEKKTIKLYLSRIKRLFDHSLQPRYNNARAFYDLFENDLNGKDKCKILKVKNYKNGILNWLSLLFDFDIRASGFNRDLRNRILIMLRIF